MSSPLRNRWQRTPPVARPLRGYSANGVTLRDAGLGAGQRVGRAREVTTTALAPDRVHGAEEHRGARRASLMPAMPPAARPCGRTAEAGKRSSCASEVMKTRSSSPSRSSTAPTTSSPSLSAMTSHSSPVRRVVGGDPLDDALRGAEGERRATSAASEHDRRPVLALLQRRRLASGAPPDRRARRRSAAAPAGRAPRARSIRPADVTRPTSPRAVVRHGADDDVVLGARPPSARQRLGRRRCGPAGRSRTAAPSTGRRRPRAALAAASTGAARRLQQHGAARRAVRLGDLGQLVGDERAQQLLVGEDRRAAPRSRARSSSRSFSSSIRENLVSRRSGMSRM